MKPPISKIVVEVPGSEARRDRIEREVFARLGAMRDFDRAHALTPRTRSWRVPLLAGAGLAAVGVLLLLATGRAPSPVEPSSPSLVVTPAGGSSRFTVGNAVIDAGSDTSVEVTHEPGGGTTLRLGRGSVDCDVTPRPNRPTFRVVSGDVIVEVVGTRFTVTRTGANTRVDVARGKVNVHGGGEQRLLGAGGSWSSGLTASLEPATPPEVSREAAPEAAPEAEPEPEIEPEPEPSRRPRRSAKAAFEAALRLERSNPKRAASAYRAIANGKDAYAAVALLNLAELHANTDADRSLRALDELARRFPGATNAEEAAWLRVDVLRAADRRAETRAAATQYLERYPQGAYAKLATRIVRPRP